LSPEAPGKTLIDEDQRYFHTVIFPIKEGDGLVTAVGGISLDITQKVRSEVALRESEEKFRLITEGSPVGVYLFMDGTFWPLYLDIRRRKLSTNWDRWTWSIPMTARVSPESFRSGLTG
jgi:PAS domain-containing protein